MLWNPQAHCRVHNSPSLVPILSQIDLMSEPSSKQKFFPASRRPDRLWGTTEPPTDIVVPLLPPPGEKRLWGDVDHSPPPSAEIKNEWSYTSTPHIRLHGVNRNNSALTLPIFHCLRRSEETANVQGFMKYFVSSFSRRWFLNPRLTPTQRIIPCRLSATACPTYSRLQSIRKRHVVVTGARISWHDKKYTYG
jgi:hypothetical protein